jgi:hypothetical protein
VGPGGNKGKAKARTSNRKVPEREERRRVRLGSGAVPEKKRER